MAATTIEAGNLVYNFVSKGFQQLEHNLRFAEKAIRQLSGIVALADPIGVRRFNTEIQVAAAAVGRIFIPILNDLAKVVKSIGEYFDSMTPAQRQVVRDLASYGAAAAIAVIAVGALSSALFFYIAALAKAAVATYAFLASNPVGWALAAASAIVVLMAAVTAFGAIVGVAGQKGESWAEKFGNAWKAVMSFVGPILEKFSVVLKQIGAIGSVFFDELIDVVGQFGVDWAQVWKFVGDGFKLFLDYFVQAVKWFAVAIAQMVNMAIKAVKAMLAIMIEAIETMKTVASYVPLAGFAVEGADKALNALNGMKKVLEQVQGFDIGKLIGKFDAAIESAGKPGKIQHDTATRPQGPPVIKDVAQVFKDAQQAQDESNNPELKLLQKQLEYSRDQKDLLKDIKDNTGGGGIR